MYLKRTLMYFVGHCCILLHIVVEYFVKICNNVQQNATKYIDVLFKYINVLFSLTSFARRVLTQLLSGGGDGPCLAGSPGTGDPPGRFPWNRPGFPRHGPGGFLLTFNF